MNRHWLITGAGGMLGRDLVSLLSGVPGASVDGRDRAGLDITDPVAVQKALAGKDIVVNTAAWTDVDGAETHEAEATRVNGIAALAAACRDAGIPLIQLSTDYVFAGDATVPYPEDAPASPVNAYGRGKLAGEKAMSGNGYVVRTSWLYGHHGKNFVRTMLSLARTREILEVVDDQIGQPTWTRALATQLVELGQGALDATAPPGTYHGTASGQTTWFGLAQAAFALAGLDPQRIRPVGSEAYPRPAKRPSYSVLGHEAWARAGLKPQPDWRDQLAAAFAAGVFRPQM